METWKSKFGRQRTKARQRGIEFLLTFDEWMSWWEATGKMHLRGRGSGKFQMGRIGDRGAYELGNIICISVEENSSAPHKGKAKPPEWRARMSEIFHKLSASRPKKVQKPKNPLKVAAAKAWYERVKADPEKYQAFCKRAGDARRGKPPWCAGLSSKD